MELTRPRIAPLGPADRDERARQLIDELAPQGREMNIFLTLVRHPGLFARFRPFLGKLLAGRLAARDREILILRTAWLCGSPYEWGQHDSIGRDAGLTEDELARIPHGPDADFWSPADRALLRATDELHSTFTISDATWAELAQTLDEHQLIEIPMVVGNYHMVAFFLNALRIEPEPGLPSFPKTARVPTGLVGGSPCSHP